MKPDTVRLFFAAWPAPEIQQALGRLAQELKRECGGRAVPARNMHLTLAFLGPVERARLACLESLADSIRARCFELAVDSVGYWRHNRIIWAGAGHCPEALRGLAANLARALASAGFRTEERGYVPHITLVRDARRAPLRPALPGVAWPVARFALVESAPDGRGRVYRMLREWPLGA